MITSPVPPRPYISFFSTILFFNLDGPDVFVSSRWITSNKERIVFVLTCTSDANPPAFVFQWFCNSTKLCNDYRNITLSETIQEGETVTSSDVAIRNPLFEDPCDCICIAVTSYGYGSAVFNSTFFRK